MAELKDLHGVRCCFNMYKMREPQRSSSMLYGAFRFNSHKFARNFEITLVGKPEQEQPTQIHIRQLTAQTDVKHHESTPQMSGTIKAQTTLNDDVRHKLWRCSLTHQLKHNVGTSMPAGRLISSATFGHQQKFLACTLYAPLHQHARY